MPPRAARATVEALWINAENCAIAFDCSHSHFLRRVVPFIPADGMRGGPGGNHGGVQYYLPHVIAAAESANLIGNSEDEDNAPSSHLERMRKVKADDAEVEFAKKCGLLISVDDWENRTAGLWGTLERYGEIFKRDFGNDGVVLFNQMVDSIKKGLKLDGGD